MRSTKQLMVAMSTEFMRALVCIGAQMKQNVVDFHSVRLVINLNQIMSSKKGAIPKQKD